MARTKTPPPPPAHQMRQTTLFDALPRARPQQPQARRAQEPDALDQKLDLALSAVFGHQGFRPGQRATCRAAAQGRDCVVILPTGGGKSCCYRALQDAMTALMYMYDHVYVYVYAYGYVYV